LNNVSDKILQDLEAYGARRLGIFKKRTAYYSEAMGFISKLMNLKEADIPLVTADLSQVLPSHTVMFQYNTVQVQGEDERHYGAVFSVKEYREIMTEEIDKFLLLPVQFIVSESFDYVNSDEVKDAYEPQKKIYELSGSKKMLDVSGISEVLDADKGGETDFGEHQITITVLEDTVKETQNAISIVVETLREMGVVFIREDLFMENCYWSQIPANFDFIRRQTYIPSAKLGGFASLYNFPAGKMTDNKWGDAVTVFRTAKGTPYFFNFHYEKSGHTSIIGPNGKGKTVLMNFLVSEAQKYSGKTYYFEQGGGSEVFINALSGKYNRITKDIEAGKLYFNPLLLKDTPRNRRFLGQWFEYLIESIASEPYIGGEVRELISKEEKQRIEKAVEENYKIPKDFRTLSTLIPKIWDDSVNSEAKNNLSNWHGIGKYSKYFDSGIDKPKKAT